LGDLCGFWESLATKVIISNPKSGEKVLFVYNLQILSTVIHRKVAEVFPLASLDLKAY
jgi:hypothetical protein